MVVMMVMIGAFLTMMMMMIGAFVHVHVHWPIGAFFHVNQQRALNINERKKW